MRHKWLLGWLIFSTAVLFWVVVQTNAQETIPYQVYLARIGRYRTQIQNPTSCEVFDRIAGELEGITAVQMPDGSMMAVEHAGADEALRQSCDVGTADRYLAGLCPGSVCAPGPAQLTQPADQPAPPSLEDFSQNSENTSPINPETGMTSPSADNNQPQNQAGETGNPASAESAAQPQPGGGEAASEAPGGENPGDNPQANSGEGSPESSSDSGGGEDGPIGETAAGGSETGGEESGASEVPSEGAAAGDPGTGGEQPGGENPANPAGENGPAGAENGDLGEAGTEGAAGEIPGGEQGAAPATAEEAQQNPAGTPTEPPPPELAPEAAVQTPLSRRTLLIISIVTIILLLLVTVLIIFYIRSRAKEEEVTPKKPQQPKPSPAVRKELDEGRQKVQQGEYREAVRKLFLAALITLDEQGAIQYDKTLTNTELLRGAVKRPSLVQPLTPVINTFERVWYGYEPLQTPEYESLVIQIHKLREKASDEYQQVMSHED